MMMNSSSPSRQFALYLGGAIAISSLAAVALNRPQTAATQAQFIPLPQTENFEQNNPPEKAQNSSKIVPQLGENKYSVPLAPIEPIQPEISPTNQIQILQCNGHTANANFRSGPSQSAPRMGIIAHTEIVQLTGKIQGDYVEAIAPYWQGQTRFDSGTGWVHKCWL